MYVPDHSINDLFACVTFSQRSQLPSWWNSGHNANEFSLLLFTSVGPSAIRLPL